MRKLIGISATAAVVAIAVWLLGSNVTSQAEESAAPGQPAVATPEPSGSGVAEAWLPCPIETTFDPSFEDLGQLFGEMRSADNQLRVLLPDDSMVTAELGTDRVDFTFTKTDGSLCVGSAAVTWADAHRLTYDGVLVDVDGEGSGDLTGAIWSSRSRNTGEDVIVLDITRPGAAPMRIVAGHVTGAEPSGPVEFVVGCASECRCVGDCTAKLACTPQNCDEGVECKGAGSAPAEACSCRWQAAKGSSLPVAIALGLLVIGLVVGQVHQRRANAARNAASAGC